MLKHTPLFLGSLSLWTWNVHICERQLSCCKLLCDSRKSRCRAWCTMMIYSLIQKTMLDPHQGSQSQRSQTNDRGGKVTLWADEQTLIRVPDEGADLGAKWKMLLGVYMPFMRWHAILPCFKSICSLWHHLWFLPVVAGIFALISLSSLGTL